MKIFYSVKIATFCFISFSAATFLAAFDSEWNIAVCAVCFNEYVGRWMFIARCAGGSLLAE